MDRAEEIRENLTYLRVQIRRHQRAGGGEGTGASLEDVNWVRQDIRALQDEVLNATNRRWSSGSMTVPEGTEIQVRLDTPLSSRTARTEDRFEATVMMPVDVDNRIVIPAGTRVRGTVVSAEPAERPARGGKLDLAFNRLELEDSTRADIRARVVSLSEGIDKSDTGKKAGIGAALGVLLGSVIGGKTRCGGRPHRRRRGRRHHDAGRGRGAPRRDDPDPAHRARRSRFGGNRDQRRVAAASRRWTTRSRPRQVSTSKSDGPTDRPVTAVRVAVDEHAGLDARARPRRRAARLPRRRGRTAPGPRTGGPAPAAIRRAAAPSSGSCRPPPDPCRRISSK